MPLEFTGKSSAITSDGLANVADTLGVQAPEIWTVFSVETKGCGFLPDRRPPILLERHIFSRLTNRQFDVRDCSNPAPGGYGASGAAQYDRLAQAIALHRDAALQSCSWGLGQIMGQNYPMLGFAGVEEMVTAMCDTEDAQLLAFAAFVKSSALDVALRAHDWTKLARGYNGPNYAINQYDVKLGAAYQKFSNGALPDLTSRTAQLYLTYAGFNPGPVDGLPGALTQAALRQFQQKNGLPATGTLDDATRAALQPAE
jgi:N-acetylmuramidase/Putative peptidoglycan binding domain